jgi:hypothetical protein
VLADIVTVSAVNLPLGFMYRPKTISVACVVLTHIDIYQPPPAPNFLTAFILRERRQEDHWPIDSNVLNAALPSYIQEIGFFMVRCSSGRSVGGLDIALTSSKF